MLHLENLKLSYILSEWLEITQGPLTASQQNVKNDRHLFLWKFFIFHWLFKLPGSDHAQTS